MSPLLAAAGCRIFTPYLHGYDQTRFLSDETPRSGQQAALAHNLLAFMDALGIQRAVLAGTGYRARIRLRYGLAPGDLNLANSKCCS